MPMVMKQSLGQVEQAASNVRLVATPGTSGRPRASPAKSKQQKPDRGPSTSSSTGTTFWSALQLKAEPKFEALKARSLQLKEKAKSKKAELLQKAEPKFGAFKARSLQLKEKAKSKKAELALRTKEHVGHCRRRAAKTAAAAELRYAELKLSLHTHLRDLQEEVRQVGYWRHPAPLSIATAVAFVLLFLGCSLGCTWPVTTPAVVHLFPGSLQESAKVNEVLEGPRQLTLETDLALVEPDMEKGPTAEELKQREQMQKLDEENTRRYLEARKALQSQQFDKAHGLLVGLYNSGAWGINNGDSDLPDPEMGGGLVGNFSRAEFFTDLGTMRVYAGEASEALGLIAAGLQKRDSKKKPQAFALNAIGMAYRSLGDYESAFGAFQTAARLSPKNPKAWSNLGVLAMELGDLQQADNAFWYAADAYGTDAAAMRDDLIFLNNVRIFQGRVTGETVPGEVASLELWYEEE